VGAREGAGDELKLWTLVPGVFSCFCCLEETNSSTSKGNPMCRTAGKVARWKFLQRRCFKVNIPDLCEYSFYHCLV